MSVVPRSSAAEKAKNAAIDRELARAAEEAHFGHMLADRGITTVALDQDGRMVEYRPDGSTTILS